MANRTKSTPRARKRFLANLMETSNVTAACAASGMSRQTVYDLRNSDPGFKSDWDAAIDVATDALEAEARRRALVGVEEPVFHLGKQVATVRKYSSRLLEILLKAHRPDKFRETINQQHSGPGGGPIAYTDLDRANRLLTLAKQRKAADPQGDD